MANLLVPRRSLKYRLAVDSLKSLPVSSKRSGTDSPVFIEFSFVSFSVPSALFCPCPLGVHILVGGYVSHPSGQRDIIECNSEI